MNSPAAQDLVLLGVVHTDPELPARLGRALAALRPGVISVEVSPYALAFRSRRGPELLARLEANLGPAARQAGLTPAEAGRRAAVNQLVAYLLPPQEWVVSRRVAAQTGALLCPLDLSAWSRRHLAGVDDLLAVDNLALLLSGPPPESAAALRRRAAYVLTAQQAGLSPAPHPLPSAPDPEREAVLARRLTRLAREAQHRGLGRVVHVGGWEHLAAGLEPPTLADRLNLPWPARRLL
ncbi:MAG: hypothetical protein KQJ78_19505 [Deltaproteobacteria bacterium]|nr:hypothetical protein [Deltaproteobacteria bacterium]